MKKLPVSIKAKTSTMERTAIVTHHVEDYWVGTGYPDRKKSTRLRRYLRIRDALGICRYFLWSEPDKGKESVVIARFKRRVKISLEQVKKHYNYIITNQEK